jgi:FHA domain
VIGRSPFADVVIADPSVAPHHAEIVVTSRGRLHLTDCATPSGTWRLGPAEDDGEASSEWRPVRQAFVREDEPLRLGEYRCLGGQLVRSLRHGGEPAWEGEAAGQDSRGGGRRALGGRVERDAVTGEIVRRRP